MATSTFASSLDLDAPPRDPPLSDTYLSGLPGVSSDDFSPNSSYNRLFQDSSSPIHPVSPGPAKHSLTLSPEPNPEATRRHSLDDGDECDSSAPPRIHSKDEGPEPFLRTRPSKPSLASTLHEIAKPVAKHPLVKSRRSSDIPKPGDVTKNELGTIESEERSHQPSSFDEKGATEHSNISRLDVEIALFPTRSFKPFRLAEEYATRSESPCLEIDLEDVLVRSPVIGRDLGNDGGGMKRSIICADYEFRPFKKQKVSQHMGGIIELWVGKPFISISIHKNVLRCPSAYFQDALKHAEHNENGDLRLRLPNSKPAITESMMHWMYYDEVFISQEAMDRCYTYGIKRESHPKCALPALVRLYLAGETYSVPRLRNDCIDGIISIDSSGQLIRMSSFIWTHTVPGSILRKLVIRLVGCHYDAEALSRDTLFINQELLYELALGAFRDRDQGRSKVQNLKLLRLNFCKEFHTHSKDLVGKCIKLKDYTAAEG